MELNKTHWSKDDIKSFVNFEQSFYGLEKDCLWEQRIVNTKLPCCGRTSTKAKEIVKEIKKGNYLEFLDGVKITTHLESLVFAFLVCSIKDFDVFEKYLDKFVLTIDNWASADTLRFQKKDYEQLKVLSQKYLKSDKPFVRRVGINIYFELVKDEKYLNSAFEVLDSLSKETEYYVNMCGAWLLSDCFARYPDKTMDYFRNNTTNDFVINKGISKCRDSYRVSKENKELLLKYKR